ncbi:MAG: 16S rRNA (guanine(527)-N(7))-methyltransferase RsmG [Treponema sp. CETP13]|nr:MAG: 16S rRNA (guanine(527)-N(7))-methyltransferase RsmG [Treponema sp. CETP13]
MLEKLQQGLNTIGFLPEEIGTIVPKIEQYLNELDMFNKVYDLCGADTKEDIIVKHILDSLSAAPKIKAIATEMKNTKANTEHSQNDDFCIADIGTGGGLPGIPLAIALPEFQFILVERMSKRCSFLENCVAILGLSNVSIINEQAERIEQQSFDIAVFRAFRPLDKKMIRVLLRILKKPNGKLIAYKARITKIESEMEGINQWVPAYKVYPLSVPFLEDRERNLVIIPTK